MTGNKELGDRFPAYAKTCLKSQTQIADEMKFKGLASSVKFHSRGGKNPSYSIAQGIYNVKGWINGGNPSERYIEVVEDYLRRMKA